MRILLVSANIRPHIGGIERFTETLAVGLRRRSHEVSILGCRYAHAPLRETAEAVSLVRLPSSYVIERTFAVPYPIPSPVHVGKRLRELVPHADVIHVQDAIYATSLPALLAARRHGVPSVLTQHVGFVPQGSHVLDAVQRLAIATIGRCARLATTVTSMNPAIVEWCKRTWNLADVRLLPVGVAPPGRPSVEQRSELRRSFGLPADRFLALFAGRNVPKKGLDTFLLAADSAYSLVAVTDNAPRNGNATILPFMSTSRFHDLLGCVDAFVLPSIGEGFPMTMQEALVAGIPVITTSQPGYEDYLGSDDVLFVERTPEAIRAALLRLLGDADLRRRLSERATAVGALHFGLERFVSEYENVYREAVAR